MGILIAVLIPPLILYWMYRKLAAKIPWLANFIYRFSGTLIILCFAAFFFSNFEHQGKRPAGFIFLSIPIPLAFALDRKLRRTLFDSFRSAGAMLICGNVAAYVYHMALNYKAISSSFWMFSALAFAMAFVYEGIFVGIRDSKTKPSIFATLIGVNVLGAINLASV